MSKNFNFSIFANPEAQMNEASECTTISFQSNSDQFGSKKLVKIHKLVSLEGFQTEDQEEKSIKP